MSIRILLADDHAVMRDGLRALLETGSDITVVGEAADGQEAVELAQRLHPDVVVMDINMPGMDGIEATRQILGACADTRVVILSMYAASNQIFQALEAGVTGYVLKECAGKEVLEAVLEAYSGVRYLSRKISEAVISNYVQQRQGAGLKPSLDCLSSRELQLIKFVVEGRSSNEIADVLGLSVKSVGTYRGRLMMKLGIKDVPGLVKFAIQQGLISVQATP